MIMNNKIFKYLFIFIIPLIILSFNISIVNDIEYDNNGNYLTTNKKIEYTSNLINYENKQLYSKEEEIIEIKPEIENYYINANEYYYVKQEILDNIVDIYNIYTEDEILTYLELDIPLFYYNTDYNGNHFEIIICLSYDNNLYHIEGYLTYIVAVSNYYIQEISTQYGSYYVEDIGTITYDDIYELINNVRFNNNYYEQYYYELLENIEFTLKCKKQYNYKENKLISFIQTLNNNLGINNNNYVIEFLIDYLIISITMFLFWYILYIPISKLMYLILRE